MCNSLKKHTGLVGIGLLYFFLTVFVSMAAIVQVRPAGAGGQPRPDGPVPTDTEAGPPRVAGPVPGGLPGAAKLSLSLPPRVLLSEDDARLGTGHQGM